MSLTIDKIEKEFEYLTLEEIANDANFPKLRGGIMLTDIQYEPFQRLAKKLEVKESAILGEIIKRFSVKHFQGRDTVSRSVYEKTVEENHLLTEQTEKLVKIIDKLNQDLSQAKSNRSADSWPTTPANNPANNLANQPANNPANISANGYANHSANRFAYGSAHGYAQNPAVSAENPATEEVLYQIVPLIVGYIKQVFNADINPQHFYAWVRQNIR